MGRRHLNLLAVAFMVVPACLAATSAHAIDGAALQKGPRGFWHLVMPDEMTAALWVAGFSFTIWPDSAYADSVRRDFVYGEHAAPFAVILDLNGDGFEDLALDGRIGGDPAVALLISNGNVYRALSALHRPAIDGTARAPGRGLSLVPADTAASTMGHPVRIFWSRPGRSNEGASISWTDSTGIRVTTFIAD